MIDVYSIDLREPDGTWKTETFFMNDNNQYICISDKTVCPIDSAYTELLCRTNKIRNINFLKNT